MSRLRGLLLFGALYFVQGGALSYFNNFQKPYLAGMGILPETIGFLTSFLLLPFVFKIFFSWASDRWSLGGLGHRKPYMVLGLVLAAAGFGSAGFMNPSTDFAWFVVCVFAGATGVALFDATTDGLALDISRAEDQGLVQSCMIGGKSLGFILFSLVFGWIAGTDGYFPVFLLISGLMLTPLLFVLRVREGAMPAGPERLAGADLRAIFRPAFLIFSAYAISYSIVSFGVDGLITYSLQKRFSVSADALGHYGAFRGLGAVLGTVMAGWLLGRMDAFKVGVLGVAGLAAGAILTAFLPNAGHLLSFAVTWGLLWAFQETCFVTFSMAMAGKTLAATSFALLMAFSNLGTAVGEALTIRGAEAFGFSQIFLIMAGLSLLVLPLLWLSIGKRGRADASSVIAGAKS